MASANASDDLRRRARSFFADAMNNDIREELRNLGSEYVPSFHKLLGSEGWIGLQWPEEVGGGGAGQLEGAIFQEEAALAGAPMLASNLSSIVGNTLIDLASKDLQERHLPGLISGESVFCLGYSEPDAGSDLSSLKTRATRDGDVWLMSGTKTFTSLAHVADFMLCLARTEYETDDDHAALTVFVVPMKDVRVEPIWTLGGFRTNTCYLDSVEVGDDSRLGGRGEGWKVVMRALDFERAGTAAARVGQMERLFGQVLDEANHRGGLTPAQEERAAQLWARVLAVRALTYEIAALYDNGAPSTVRSSVVKVAGTELLQEITRFGVDALGPRATVAASSPFSIADGDIESEYRNAVRYTVTAGTSEIQRNIIAKRGLGLGRSA